MDSGCYWMKHRIPKALVNSMPENATIFSLLDSRRILVNFSVLQEINIHKWLHGGVMILGFPSQRETAQNYSSLAKITKNLHVVKPNGFSIFILFLSCTQQSWTLHLKTLCSFGFLDILLSWLAFYLLATSPQSSWLAPSLHLYSNSWNTLRA